MGRLKSIVYIFVEFFYQKTNRVLEKNIKIVFILFCLFVGCCQNLYSQIDENNRKKWIQKISEYRNYLILQNPESTNELKLLLEKWTNLGVSEEEQNQLMVNVVKLKAIDEDSSERVVKMAHKHMPEVKIAQHLTVQDVTIIAKNAELLDLVHLDILKSKYSILLV